MHYCEKQKLHSYAKLKKEFAELAKATKRLKAANKKLVAENAEIIAKNDAMRFENESLPRAVLVDEALMDPPPVMQLRTSLLMRSEESNHRMNIPQGFAHAASPLVVGSLGVSCSVSAGS